MNRLACLHLTERSADILLPRHEVKDARDLLGAYLAMSTTKLTEYVNVPILSLNSSPQIVHATMHTQLPIQICILEQVQAAQRRHPSIPQFPLDLVAGSDTSTPSDVFQSSRRNRILYQHPHRLIPIPPPLRIFPTCTTATMTPIPQPTPSTGRTFPSPPNPPHPLHAPKRARRHTRHCRSALLGGWGTATIWRWLGRFSSGVKIFGWRELGGTRC
jgi:hypothetical protein